MAADERRQAILLALYRRKKETRANLAFEFHVSKRTLETDIEALSLAHYPVYTKQGIKGGIFIDEDYVPDVKFFNDLQTELVKRLLPTLQGNDKEIMLTIIDTYCAKR